MDRQPAGVEYSRVSVSCDCESRYAWIDDVNAGLAPAVAAAADELPPAADETEAGGLAVGWTIGWAARAALRRAFEQAGRAGRRDGG